MSRPYRVAVVGCGVAGAATAYLLARDGHAVTLLEQAEVLGPVGARRFASALGPGRSEQSRHSRNGHRPCRMAIEELYARHPTGKTLTCTRLRRLCTPLPFLWDPPRRFVQGSVRPGANSIGGRSHGQRCRGPRDCGRWQRDLDRCPRPTARTVRFRRGRGRFAVPVSVGLRPSCPHPRLRSWHSLDYRPEPGRFPQAAASGSWLALPFRAFAAGRWALLDVLGLAGPRVPGRPLAWD